MQTVTLASSHDDVAAADAIQHHHAEMLGSVELRVQALIGALQHDERDRLEPARRDLVAWCRRELVPHAEAEEATLYLAARQVPGLEPLIRAMSHEHGVLQDLIARLDAGGAAATVVADAGALRTLFTSHVAKENELILPALAADPDVSLADLLERMHATVPSGEHAHADAAPTDDAAAAPHTTCGCHAQDEDGLPELDVRAIPHAIRHATVFGALDGLDAGAGVILIAPHDPLPLLAQLEQRHPDGFDVGYLERGPVTWRLSLVRRGA